MQCCPKEYADQILTLPELKKTFHIHAKPAKINKHQAYIIYLTDLTAKNAEAPALFDLTNDMPGSVGIYHVYDDQRIELIYMNKAFFKMIGTVREEALQKDSDLALSLIWEEDRAGLWAEIKEALAQNRAVDISLRMRVLDGQYHWLRLNGRHIKKDSEKNTFFCRFTEIEPPKQSDIE